METTYLVCAAIGGTLIVCQFLMTLFGLGGGHDFAGDHGDVSGHGDVGGHDGGGHDGASDHQDGHSHDSAWFLGLLTFRTVSAGLAFFGLVGVIGQRADFEPVVALLLAVAAGMGALLLVGWIMRFLGRLNIDGTVRIERSLGCHGTVYVPVSAGGNPGKVQVSVLHRTMEYKATSQMALPTGAKIVVIGIVSSDTVEVAPARD